MIKTILLSVDGSAYTEPVLQYGIQFARKFEAYLKVLTIIDVRIFEWAVAIGVEGFAPIIPSPTYQEESQKLLEQKAEQVLKRAGEILNREGVSHSLEKENGNPIDVICEKARLVDLVVMGAHGEFSRWSEKMLGTTVESVARLIIKPLMIVPKKFREIQKILLAYDGSENSSKALTMAAFLASSFKVPLTVLNVNDSPEEGERIVGETREYLQAYHIPEIQEKVVPGVAAEKIVEVSQSDHSDLIIMGSFGHSRIREAILGSTTVQVMRKVDVPLLMVR